MVIYMYTLSIDYAISLRGVEMKFRTKAVQAIRDLLWYVDGSHATLSERGCGVPDLLQKFVGYNRPEQHKHRKWQTHSL